MSSDDDKTTPSLRRIAALYPKLPEFFLRNFCFAGKRVVLLPKIMTRLFQASATEISHNYDKKNGTLKIMISIADE